MRKFIILILLAAFMPIGAQNYQYQYFNKDKKKHAPFSDYIPRIRNHYQTHPHYVEDYYELYGKKLYHNETSMRVNIRYLETALTARFRHPSQALVRVRTKKEYKKYRKLLYMHINLLIMRNHMRIASRYDKQKLYFYNYDFAKDIRDSLVFAEKYYKDAMPYWNRAKRYAKMASRIKISTRLSFMESERYSIITKELNYGRIIKTYVKRVNKKKHKLNKYLTSNGS
jgi:hypothetical protein